MHKVSCTNIFFSAFINLMLIYTSAVERLITINPIQNKIYIIYVCVLCIFIMYI